MRLPSASAWGAPPRLRPSVWRGCIYNGDCTHDVHSGFGVAQAEFCGLVHILNDAMVRRGLAIRGRNERLALLSPMKRDVVEG
jgi:hypothetical protein